MNIWWGPYDNSEVFTQTMEPLTFSGLGGGSKSQSWAAMFGQCFSGMEGNLIFGYQLARPKKLLWDTLLVQTAVGVKLAEEVTLKRSLCKRKQDSTQARSERLQFTCRVSLVHGPPHRHGKTAGSAKVLFWLVPNISCGKKKKH